MTLNLERFAHETIEEKAADLGVSIEEFAKFAVLYYLADLDSGRMARRIPPSDRLTSESRGALVERGRS